MGGTRLKGGPSCAEFGRVYQSNRTPGFDITNRAKRRVAGVAAALSFLLLNADGLVLCLRAGRDSACFQMLILHLAAGLSPKFELPKGSLFV